MNQFWNPKNVDNNSGEKPAVACDECGHSTKTKNGLKLHKKNKYAKKNKLRLKQMYF